MDRDPLLDALDLIAKLFPQTKVGAAGGAVTTSQRTVGSDLDIVVLLPDGDPPAPHRDSRQYRGWPVELFVHDEQSLVHYLAKDLPVRRPIIHRMVATGRQFVGDAGPWKARCAAILAAGPVPLTVRNASTPGTA